MNLRPPLRIGVDVGGTFTDLVVTDADDRIEVAKVPSVRGDPANGVIAALDQLAGRVEGSVTELVAACEVFVHGSTVATNTLLEGTGASVGLLTTAGFRDTLAIRRGIREDQWDHRTPFPPVLVTREHRRPAEGRILADGTEDAPLDLGDVAAAAEHWSRHGIEAVAVCLLHSYREPSHEAEAAAALRQTWPGELVTESSRLAPVLGEYERCSTAVVNATLTPRIGPYLAALAERLAALGLRSQLFLLQSNGGAIDVEHVRDRPVHLVLSGPAAGVGALRRSIDEAGSSDLLSMEIGGTSCDVMLMTGGDVPVTEDLVVGGYHLATPSVAVHTIGAGGGTIARVDDGGLLVVGPAGAGADPGPAAYGRGGTLPTVTDAQLVLGRLQPGPYADGAIVLDADLAATAIERHVATPLGLDVETAATGIIRLLEQHLLQAVERITLERGHDPRRLTLVAAGGAGPMHGCSVGRALGCRQVLVPRLAGAFCAVGMLHSDVRHDLTAVATGRLDEIDPAALTGRFEAMEDEGRARLAAGGFGADDSRFERSVELRYPGQQSSLRVPASGDLRAGFEALYESLYGHVQPGGAVELTGLRVAALGGLPPMARPHRPPAAAPPSPGRRQRMWIDPECGHGDVPVYRGEDLAPGHTVAGPLLVEERTTTVVVLPGDTLHVTPGDDLLITPEAPPPGGAGVRTARPKAKSGTRSPAATRTYPPEPLATCR